MNEEERDIMRRHAAYWAKLMHEGVAVVFGPVADPKGGWGAGVLRVESEESLKKLCAADPAILSGKGFSYETLPMPAAVYRA